MPLLKIVSPCFNLLMALIVLNFKQTTMVFIKWVVLLFILLNYTTMTLSGQDRMRETATMGGGCFWCLEALFQMVDGVEAVVPGYSAGHTSEPTYRDVCTGLTGHAEVVQIVFNPAKVSYRRLLELFFESHDPTTVNRQGNDIGDQYRSILLYHTQQQKQVAIDVIQALEKSGELGDPIVTQVVSFERFYPAEAYHHDYYRRNSGQSYCRVVIGPKVAKFRRLLNEKP